MENCDPFSQLLDAYNEVQANRERPQNQEIENLKQEARRFETITQNLMVENAEIDCDFQIENDRMEFDREHNADIAAMNTDTLKRLVETGGNVKEVEGYPDDLFEEYKEVRAMRVEARTFAQTAMESINTETKENKVKCDDLKLKMVDTEAQRKQQILNFQAEISLQSNRLFENQAIFGQHKKKIDQLSMELTGVKRLYDDEKLSWENKCRLIENYKIELENQLAHATSTLNVLNVEIADLAGENANLKETIDNSEKEVVRRVKNHDNLDAEKQRYVKQASELDEKLQELKKTSADLTIANQLNLRVIRERQQKNKTLDEQIAIKDSEDIINFLNASPIHVRLANQNVRTPSQLGEVTFTDSNSPKEESASAMESLTSFMNREYAPPLCDLTNKQSGIKELSKVKRKVVCADGSEEIGMDMEPLSPKKTKLSVDAEPDFIKEFQVDNDKNAKFKSNDDIFDTLVTMPPPPLTTAPAQSTIKKKKTNKTKQKFY